MTDFTLKCNGKILHEYCILVYIVHSLTLSQMKHSGDTFQPLASTFASCMDNPNGSQVNGGCPASCVIGTTICQCSDGNTSGLHIDGIIPDIDTSNTGSWANQLFAICTHSTNVPIGFQFHEPVLITSVELNIFICYEWIIPQLQFNVTISTSAHITSITESILGNLVVDMTEGNCNSLTRLIIDLKSNMTSTNYIVKFISKTPLIRLYIGEIVFRNQTSEVSCKLYFENKNFSTRPQAFLSLYLR